MTRYRLRVKGLPNWRAYSTACLAISVGNPAHEDLKLKSAVSWIADNFTDCIVDLSDSLQRWKYLDEPNVDMAQATRLALEQGNRWISRNEAVLNRLPNNSQIVRWDHWLNHPDFESVHNKFNQLYQLNAIFQNAVEIDARRFLARRDVSNLSLVQIDSILDHCRSFILEEVSAHTILNRETPTAKIYPSQSLEALSIVREGKISDAPRGLENECYVRITLNRIEQISSKHSFEMPTYS